MKFSKCLMSGVLVSVMSFSAYASEFEKGDIVADVNFGVGVAKNYNQWKNDKEGLKSNKVMRGSFTQRIGVEFGICDLGNNMSLGLGFSFNNAVIGSTSRYVTGKYNYSYSLVSHSWHDNRWHSDSKVMDRNGSGNAIAKGSYDDFSALVRFAFHYSPVSKLDAYVGLGFGVSYYHTGFSDFKDKSGFSADSKKFDSRDHSFQLSYDYNDLDHVEWDGGNAEGRLASAFYVGARYYVTDHLAVQGELGLPCMTFKKNLADYSLLSLGVSYKF